MGASDLGTYYTNKIPHASDLVGSFWWRDILKLTPQYRGVSCVQVVDGTTTLFWKDLWLDNTLDVSHPRAFSFALHEDASIKDFLESTSLHDLFHLPLSPEALMEVRDLQSLSTRMRQSTTIADVWHYTWGQT